MQSELNRISNGLLIQWGRATIYKTQTTVELPISYENDYKIADCYYHDANSTLGHIYGLKTLSSFVCVSTYQPGLEFEYITIGY